jgi:hypothetical protein
LREVPHLRSDPERDERIVRQAQQNLPRLRIDALDRRRHFDGLEHAGQLRLRLRLH